MTELEEAKQMLAKAVRDGRAAREALDKSLRDKERAERMIASAKKVSQGLRKMREENHFTETIYRLFGGTT